MTLHKPNRSARSVVRRKPEKLSQFKKERANAELTRRKKCNQKKRYDTKELAQAHCERMLSRVPLQLTPMEPYYCYRHQAWHVGHDWLKYHTERRQEW